MHGHGSGSRHVVKVAGGERGVNESHLRATGLRPQLAPGEMGAPRTRPVRCMGQAFHHSAKGTYSYSSVVSSYMRRTTKMSQVALRYNNHIYGCCIPYPVS